jgi:pilus assembly protein CpaF
MLQAMNTGHDGSMTTVHANTPQDALSRVEQMIGMAGLEISPRSVRQQIASAINVVVQAERMDDGRRRVVSITEIVGMEEDIITTQEIFRFRRQGKSPEGQIVGAFETTGVRPRFLDAVIARGIELPEGLSFGAGRKSV